MNTLQYYISCFTSMNCNKYRGHVAPHKAMMLIAVMDEIDNGHLTNGFVPHHDGMVQAFESAFHLYSAIFGYEYASYMATKIKESNPVEPYSIGIVCPYKKQADSIKQMIELRDISNASCKVHCGTVHSFQGDECDIMSVVLNPPMNVGQNSHVNNQNIIMLRLVVLGIIYSF